MKRYLFCCLTTILTLSAFLIGCKEKKEGAAAHNNDIKFQTIRIEKTYHMLDNNDNPGCNLEIKFTYPDKYSHPEILKELQKQFISSYFGDYYDEMSPEEAVAAYTEDYLKNYQSLEDDFKDELSHEDGSSVSAWFSYYETSSNDVTYNKNGLLSYSVAFEGYTGGAHGAHSFTNHVLNLETGQAVTEEDIFVEDYQDKLAEILVDHIATANEVKDPKELENIGFFSIDEIYPNGNFLVDDSGLTYDFNEYEIAAYVVGNTKVKLPWKEIRHLLKQESPVSLLFKN